MVEPSQVPTVRPAGATSRADSAGRRPDRLCEVILLGLPACQALLGSLDLDVLTPEHSQQDLAVALVQLFGDPQAMLAQDGRCVVADAELEDSGGALHPLSPGRSADPRSLRRRARCSGSRQALPSYPTHRASASSSRYFPVVRNACSRRPLASGRTFAIAWLGVRASVA